jgi:hypothetical protein
MMQQPVQDPGGRVFKGTLLMHGQIDILDQRYKSPSYAMAAVRNIVEGRSQNAPPKPTGVWPPSARPLFTPGSSTTTFAGLAGPATMPKLPSIPGVAGSLPQFHVIVNHSPRTPYRDRYAPDVGTTALLRRRTSFQCESAYAPISRILEILKKRPKIAPG